MCLWSEKGSNPAFFGQVLWWALNRAQMWILQLDLHASCYRANSHEKNLEACACYDSCSRDIFKNGAELFHLSPWSWSSRKEGESLDVFETEEPHLLLCAAGFGSLPCVKLGHHTTTAWRRMHPYSRSPWEKPTAICVRWQGASLSSVWFLSWAFVFWGCYNGRWLL